MALPTENRTPRPRKRSSWTRFSLRTLLILLTIFGVWLGKIVNGVVSMRRAAGFVSEIGGEVYYHYEPDSGERTRIRWENDRRASRRGGQRLPPIVDTSQPPGPAWLRDFVGVDYFREVSEVQLSKSQVQDKDLARLRPFRRLKTLSIAGRDITDAGLEVLPNFPQIETLRLQGTQITDDGLEHLAKYKSLKTLDLTGLDLSVEAITRLQKQLPATDIRHSAK